MAMDEEQGEGYNIEFQESAEKSVQLYHIYYLQYRIEC